MIHYLTIGLMLGLSAGLTPGPLMTLIISETLKHNIRAGIKVSLSPVVTDLPIVLISFFILAGLSRFRPILGLVSISGIALWLRAFV